jgi:dCMP deaminase
MDKLKWDARYLELADQIGSWSKDPTTKVGCVIVGMDGQILSTGFNGFPRRVNDDVPERYDRPDKYSWTEHAERNAIYNAALSGMSLRDGTLYVPWHPCADCARGIIQSGIWCVVLKTCEVPERWVSSCTIAATMFEEANLPVIWRD